MHLESQRRVDLLCGGGPHLVLLQLDQRQARTHTSGEGALNTV